MDGQEEKRVLSGKTNREAVVMTFGERLQSLRKAGGMSQEQFAERMGVSRQAVSKWETGESMPDVDKLTTMGRVLGVSVDRLLGSDDRPGGQDFWGPAGRFVKRHGYIGGYIISGYSLLVLGMMRLAAYTTKRMMPPPEFFDEGAAIPTPPTLVFANAVSWVALAGVIGGIVLAAVLKKKGRK